MNGVVAHTLFSYSSSILERDIIEMRYNDARIETALMRELGALKLVISVGSGLLLEEYP